MMLLSSAVAAEPVYRCEDAQGRRIFSDQPCQHFGALALPSGLDPATATAPSAEELAAMRALLTPEPSADAALPAPPPPEADGCPGADPDRLALALQSALEAADLNRLAGLFHWTAAGPGTARRVFERAESLLRAGPLTASPKRRTDADDWLWAGLPPPELPPLPDIELRRADDGAVERFSLIANAGCVWLLP